MFKKLFLYSLIANFFFTNKIFAAESGGMPQLDPEFWISQIFWLVLTFGFLYIVLSKLILPKKNKEKVVKLNLKNLMGLFLKVKLKQKIFLKMLEKK